MTLLDNWKVSPYQKEKHWTLNENIICEHLKCILWQLAHMDWISTKSNAESWFFATYQWNKNGNKIFSYLELVDMEVCLSLASHWLSWTELYWDSIGMAGVQASPTASEGCHRINCQPPHPLERERSWDGCGNSLEKRILSMHYKIFRCLPKVCLTVNLWFCAVTREMAVLPVSIMAQRLLITLVRTFIFLAPKKGKLTHSRISIQLQYFSFLMALK